MITKQKQFSESKAMNVNVHRVIFILALINFVFCLECKNDAHLIFEKNFTKHSYLGCEIENWKGEKCVAFRGIRYAKPPIGAFRFKDPEALESLPLYTNAQYEGQDCSSIFSKNSSEDCLFVNIYSKRMDPGSGLRPVIVFIHPGGLYLGSGSSTFLGPEYLLEKDIVVVTFNYRLGSIGFLSLGTPSIPGNAGFKDQVLALRWVNKNIEYFGGDRNKITLMGYSAGAFSVCLHLVSPMSQGLFQKAIVMSGSIPPQTTIPLKHQVELAKKQSLIMGCKESDLVRPNGIVDCLFQFTGMEISETLRKMFYFGRDNPIYLWLPVIEENFGQERFIIEDPLESFKFSRFGRVPILIGFTNGEFCTSAKDILANEILLNEFQQSFEHLSPVCFMYSKHMNEKKITQAIRSEYLKNNTIFDKTHLRDLCNLFSDSIIRFGVQKIAHLAAKHVKVYPYRFSYEGQESYLKYPGHQAVEHLDDLMYLFKMPLKQFNPEDSESKIVENMVNFFTYFAENGKPEETFDFNTHNFFEIGSKIQIGNGYYFEKYQFWDNVTKYQNIQ